jgi:prolyl 4-hydroxylase
MVESRRDRCHQGAVNDLLDRAEALASGGNVAGAVDLLQRAERAGDAGAARQLAVWCLSGRWFRRDLAASRALFGRAAALGDDDAAAVHRAFLANGTGGDADWPGAIALLGDAARNDPAAADQLRLIAAMDLADDGGPRSTPAPLRLSDAAEVVHFPSFLTADECAYLMEAATPLLEPNVVVDPRSGQLVPHPIRTSSGAAFPLANENPAIHALNRRIAAASATDVRAGEPLQVLRYAPGEQYRPHMDALPGVAPAQQRALTFLVYLNEGYDGGETDFPRLGVRFKGRAGDALMFRNASADGRADERMIHAGLPVTRGVKHLASRWIRAAPLVYG